MRLQSHEKAEDSCALKEMLSYNDKVLPLFVGSAQRNTYTTPNINIIVRSVYRKVAADYKIPTGVY